MKTEYKQTPLGRIPEEWEVVRLSDVILDIADGGTPPTKIKEYFNGNIPWINIEDIKKDIYNTRRYLSENGLKNSSAKLWNEETIIFSFGATIGRVGIARVKLCTKQGIAGIVPNPKKVDNQFLYYVLLKESNKIKNIGKSMGSTIREVRPPMLKKLVIFLQPKKIEEQRKIAEILSITDDAIQRVNDAIAKTERLKKGLMQELLTKGIGHEKFKDTKIGRIPEEWRVDRLGNHINLKSGLYFKFSEFRSNGIRCLKIDNVGFGGIVWDTVTYLPDDYLSKYQELVLKIGDVVIALNRPIINNQLKIGILSGKDSPSILYQRVGKIVFKEESKIRKDYFFFLLTGCYFKNQLSRWLIGTDQPYIRTPVFLKIKIPLPPLPEQKKIAEILSTVDKKLEFERRRMEKLKRVKKGLMNDLLTGKKRVRVGM